MSNPIQVAFGVYLQTLGSLISAVATDSTGKPAIYYARGLQDSNADPYLIYEFSNYIEEQEIGGPPVVARADVAVKCYSASPDSAQTLAQVIDGIFRFQNLPFSMPPFVVLGTWIKDVRDEQDADIGLFAAVVEVGMQFEIS